MRVAVLFGGLSRERDVSIATAGQVFRALRERGHEVYAVDTANGRLTPDQEDGLVRASVAVSPPAQADLPTGDFLLQLAAPSGELRAADVVFLALHGGSGEDGTVQALLDVAGICYTGTGHRASAIAMDKDLSKRLFRAAGIPTPEWRMWSAATGDIAAEIGEYPLIVKPNTAGSTIGLSIVEDAGVLDEAVQEAMRHDPDVLLERFVAGREFVVGVLDGHALAVGEIVPQHSEIFDYQSKYQPGGAIETFPAEITDDQTARLQKLALQAHGVLGLGSYSRIDFRMDHRGEFWCLEANTLPGMTSTSLLPQSAEAVGISFSDLCEKVCLLALKGGR